MSPSTSYGNMVIDNNTNIEFSAHSGVNLMSPIHDQENRSVRAEGDIEIKNSPEKSPQLPAAKSVFLDLLHYGIFSNLYSASFMTIAIVVFQVNSIYQVITAGTNVLALFDECSWLVEVVVNMYFGHCFMRDHMLDHIICSSTNIKSQRQYVTSLERIFAIAYILSWVNAFPFFVTIYTAGDDDTFGSNETWLSVFNNLMWQYYLFINFYLCGIWCWSIYIKYSVFQTEVITNINKEDPLAFKMAVFEFDKKLQIESKYWRSNHILRTITGFFIIIYHVHSAYLDMDKSFEFLASILTIILYYGSIWSVYICAGYVNDMVRVDLLSTLNSFDAEDDSITNRLTYVITSVSTTFQGIGVSGLHMNTIQSIGVGYIMIVIVIILVRLHVIAS